MSAKSRTLPLEEVSTQGLGLRSGAALILSLIAIGLLALGVHLLIQGQWITHMILQDARKDAHQILAAASAIRTYVEESIIKRLKRGNSWEYYDIYVMASGYVTREILENVRRDCGNFVVRFASRHPLNASALATEREREIIRFFEENPQAVIWEGRSQEGGEEWLWVARPRRFEASCLQCHALQEDCPAEIRATYQLRYGAPKEGEVVIDVAGISLSESFANARKWKAGSLLLNSLVCLSFLTVIIAVVWRGWASQRRFATQLAVAKQALMQVAETGRTILCHLASDGRIVFVSDLVSELLGYSPEELTGQKFAEALAWAEDTSRLSELIAELRRTGRLSPTEVRLRSSSGQARWFTISGCQVSHYDKGDAGFVVGLTDIEARKRAFEKAEKAARNLTNVLDVLPTGVVVIGPDRKIRYVNEAGARLLAAGNREALIGENCYDIHISCRRRSGLPCPIETQKPQKPREMVIRTRDRGEIPALGSGTPIDWADEEAFALVLVDISELKAKEEELVYLNRALQEANETLEGLYREAESATRAKSEFLANMSHEIRTPLTAILGYTELLLAEVDGAASPQMREALEIVHRNGQYLLRLIEDILDLAKIEAGKLRVEKTRCHLPTLMADILSLMRVRAAAKNLTLTIESEGPVPEYIETDPIRLRQILINLVGNAIKFTELGSVRVIVRTVTSGDGKLQLTFDVVDTGIGIPPEQLEEIFEPFHQVDGSASRRHGGTGLGLTISRRLAQMLGGDITVQSTVGRGSTFTLTIDPGDLLRANLINGAITSAERQPSDLKNGKADEIRISGRILLAEDGPDNQRFFDFILRRAGAEVTVVEDGQHAVEAALAAAEAGRPFDLVLMDMQMPVMDGYEATRRLREAGYQRPIVALTAHAMDGAAEECRAAGCDDYISKPVDRLAFLKKVAAILSAQNVREQREASAAGQRQ